MGYGVYEDHTADLYRWAGYAVPAECDMPHCTNRIDRGLGYKCETDANHNENDDLDLDGCDLFFCMEHLYSHPNDLHGKPDLPEWSRHMLTHESWKQWREESPKRVAELRGRFSPIDRLRIRLHLYHPLE